MADVRGWSSAALLAALLPGAAAAAGPAAAADERLARAVRAHVEFLAADALRGRDAGSPEYEIAAGYVAARFRELGLEPAGAGGGYLQPVPFLRSGVDPAATAVEAQAAGETVSLTWREDFLQRGDPARPETAVTAPVVLGGYGIIAPELGWDDYAGLDVEGKIVLLLGGAPASFPADQRAYYSSHDTKIAELVGRGAIGMLTVSTREEEARIPWARRSRNPERAVLHWREPDGAIHDAFPQIRAQATLSHAGAVKLLGRSGVELEEVLAAASAGRPLRQSLPIDVTVRQRTQLDEVTSSNVAGLLPGSDPTLREEIVVYTAHLDHVGVGEPAGGDAIYNGAYDNAAGIGVLLETARLASEGERPRRSILFLAVTAEEKGLLGSEYFVAQPTLPGRIVANVNLDMPLLLFPLADLVAFGAEHSSLGAVVERAAAAAGFALSPDPVPEEVIFIRSDQYSFVRAGVPAVFLVAGLRSRDPAIDGAAAAGAFRRDHYHMPSDDLALPFDGPSAARFTRANLLIGLEVANADAPPVWNQGDFFGERFGAEQRGRPERTAR